MVVLGFSGVYSAGITKTEVPSFYHQTNKKINIIDLPYGTRYLENNNHLQNMWGIHPHVLLNLNHVNKQVLGLFFQMV